MFKLSRLRRVTPWRPPPRADNKVTMPPPPGGEVNGLFGVSVGYSDRLARTPYWKRMAMSTYSLRMRENETRYPMSAYRPGQYDLRYTPTPFPDHIKHHSLIDIGEPYTIPKIRIPVIFLVNLYDKENNRWFGKKYETVYVDRDFAKEELLPQRYAIYATPQAYELLQLPVVNHAIHSQIPKSDHEYRKILDKQNYDEERWKYTIEYLFRKYENGPPELLDKTEDNWDGEEEITTQLSAGAGEKGEGAKRKGPIKHRKARKIKLF